ncbi:unnamed protein product, partial [Ectocarpus sp. 13 AM-2016]
EKRRGALSSQLLSTSSRGSTCQGANKEINFRSREIEPNEAIPSAWACIRRYG